MLSCQQYYTYLNPYSPESCKQTTNDPNSNTSIWSPNPDLNCDELNNEISMEEVEVAIHANNDHKSPGIDGIKPAFIKNVACTWFIHALCNYCFKSGTVPSAWLEVIIKPIPKGKPSPLNTEVLHCNLLLRKHTIGSLITDLGTSRSKQYPKRETKWFLAWQMLPGSYFYSSYYSGEQTLNQERYLCLFYRF